MERKYIWFHTGPAFVLGSAGAIIASVVTVLILSEGMAIVPAFLLSLAFTTALLVPAFLVDQRIRRSNGANGRVTRRDRGD